MSGTDKDKRENPPTDKGSATPAPAEGHGKVIPFPRKNPQPASTDLPPPPSAA